MSNRVIAPEKLESRLATLLSSGTWLASSVIAIGLVLSRIAAVDSREHFWGARIATFGIAMFILLPVLRVMTMLVSFLQTRDYRFAGVAALVLTILAVGFALGTR
ncbi:MAG: DUF1634 domain-containing protein [Polyangiaceae bacterium]